MSNHTEPWRYWNKTRNEIPDDLSSIDGNEKDRLLEQWESGVWTENKPTKDEILKNIKSLPEIDVKVTKWVMDRLKECIDDFVKQKYLSSIALAGAISEYHTFNLIEQYIKSNGIYPIIKESGLLKQQHDRIALLRRLDIITETERKSLENVNFLRNKYLHIHTINYSNLKQDCLNVMKRIIEFLVAHPIS